MRHEPRHEAQPIADQMMAQCSCGWRKPVSLHDHPTRTAVWGEVHRLFANHVESVLEKAT